MVKWANTAAWLVCSAEFKYLVNCDFLLLKKRVEGCVIMDRSIYQPSL